MEIILLERVENLGNMGDIVTVKNGYARNYLLPQEKALRATAANRARFEQRRAELESANLARRGDAQSVAHALDGRSCVLLRQASDSGYLYGSVTARDIAGAISELGAPVDRRQVLLDRPIKALGVHPVRLRLHPEVSTIVQVIAARSEADAEAQRAALAGEDVPAEGEAEDTATEPEDEAPSGGDPADGGAPDA